METTKEEQIEDLLNRGVSEVIDKEDLKKALEGDTHLRIKFGIDPTSSNIHLGRSVPLLKLKDFQNLGHKIILIVGDFTAVIGDTSDKESERPMLSKEEVLENKKTYLEQVGKIIDIKKTEIRHNSEWLKNLTYKEIGEQADQFSLSEFISRENIHKRIKEGKRVSLREVLYPLMQGFDSVAVSADVEVGGTDQRFNLLAGRTLLKWNNKKPQHIITCDLILGLDGRKMSSSWGNTVNITDTPDDMYGKLLRLNDSELIPYLTLCTRTPIDKIEEFKEKLKKEEINPKEVKMFLAREIVSFYHGVDKAQKAEENFETTFGKNGTPSKIESIFVSEGEVLSDVLFAHKFIESKNEFRRLVSEGAITHIDSGEKVTNQSSSINKGVYKIGKRRFINIKFS